MTKFIIAATITLTSCVLTTNSPDPVVWVCEVPGDTLVVVDTTGLGCLNADSLVLRR